MRADAFRMRWYNDASRMNGAIALFIATTLQASYRCPPDNPNAIGAVENYASLPIDQLRIVEYGVVLSSDRLTEGAPIGFVHRLRDGATFFQSRSWDLLPPATISQVSSLLHDAPVPRDNIKAIGTYMVRIMDLDQALLRANARYIPCIASDGS